MSQPILIRRLSLHRLQDCRNFLTVDNPGPFLVLPPMRERKQTPPHLSYLSRASPRAATHSVLRGSYLTSVRFREYGNACTPGEWRLAEFSVVVIGVLAHAPVPSQFVQTMFPVCVFLFPFFPFVVASCFLLLSLFSAHCTHHSQLFSY